MRPRKQLTLFLTLSLFLLGSLTTNSIGAAHATSSTATNIINNPSFENGSDPNGVPAGWQFNGCEGVGKSTVSQDINEWTDGNYSAKITTGPVTPGGCIAPYMRQSATCSGFSQPSLTCIFGSGLTNDTLVAFCMGMSGAGNAFSVRDTLAHTFANVQEVTTNVHVACGYSLTYTRLAYLQSGSDTVTFTFQPNSFNDSAVVYEVLGPSPVNNSGPCSGSGSGSIFGCSTQVAVYGYPFIFSMVASTMAMANYTAGSHFISTNITSTGTTQYSSSPLITSTSCQSSNNNIVSYGMVCVFMGLQRVEGFSQFSQQLPGYNFTELTDSPNGFSFWFKLQPYNTNGIAAFEVRIFGAETGAELEYVFDPDPSVGQYSNITSPYYTYSLLFYGYQPGQWYHFSRNLRADWTSLGLPLSYRFQGIQFEGFSTQSGTILKSETFSLDDVRAYVGTGPLPSSSAWTNFHFTDPSGTAIDNLIQWTITDSQGQIVTYTLGQSTLIPGPYYLKAYYRSIQSAYLIYKQQIHLNTTFTVSLPIFPNPTTTGTYVALNDSATTASIQPSSNQLVITIHGPPGMPYRMLVDLSTHPTLVQQSGSTLQEGHDWTYNQTNSITIITFAMSTNSENFTLLLPTPTPPCCGTLVLPGLVLAIVGIAALVLGVVVWRRRRIRPQTAKAPKQPRSAKTQPNRSKYTKDKKKR